MERYNCCLDQYTARRAGSLSAKARRRFQLVCAMTEAWHNAYLGWGWNQQPGTFWFDANGGDTLRKEQMLAAIERAIRQRCHARHRGQRAWEKEMGLILVGILKTIRAANSESWTPIEFERARRALIRTTENLCIALRTLPAQADGPIVTYLNRIRENMAAFTAPAVGYANPLPRLQFSPEHDLRSTVVAGFLEW